MPSDVVSELQSLFERLAAELPPEAASLRVYDHSLNGPKIIELVPSNPAAATFGVVADKEQVHSFSFGARSYWEFPYERRYRYDEKDVVSEIEEMSRAVIAGQCEETRGLISITGRIYVGDYTYKMTTIPCFTKPLCGSQRYAPYSRSDRQVL